MRCLNREVGRVGRLGWCLILLSCVAGPACRASDADPAAARMSVTADASVAAVRSSTHAETADTGTTTASPAAQERNPRNASDSSIQGTGPRVMPPPANDQGLDGGMDVEQPGEPDGGQGADAEVAFDSGSGEADEHAPVGVGPEGDRRACLEPPWVPSPDGLDAATVECTSATQLGFELGSGTLATDEQARDFMKQHERELVDTKGVITVAVGTSVCCGGGWSDDQGGCVAIALAPLCVVPVSELVERVRTWQLADPDAAQLKLRVSISLLGRLEPRCPPGECGPVSYTGEASWEGGQRTIIRSRSVEGPRCSDDGECFFSEASACLHWTADYLIDSSPFYPELANAFCGCVDDRCAWFE